MERNRKRFSCQLHGRRPLWRILIRVALMGAFLGPFIGLFLHWVTNVPLASFFSNPLLWVAYGCAIGAIFSVSFFFMVGVPMRWLSHRFEKWPIWKLWLVIIPAAMVCGSLACVVAIALCRVLLGIDIALNAPIGKWAIIDGMMAAVIAVVMSTLGRRELRARQLSEAAAKAQAYALQAQINPHFFFNTLNTISALVPTDGPAAQRMIGRLAEMFRYTLASSHGDLVPLEREIEFVRNYLLLEKERYRQRLEFNLPQLEDMKGIQVPGLTLQPLVENAIRYGIAKRMDGGMVNVEVKRKGDAIVVSVLNQTDGAVTVEEKPGHALSNVRERLKLAFGEAAKMSWSIPSVDWIEVRVQVPAG